MAGKEDWIECRLGDVLTLKRGYDLPQKERIPGPVPIVSSSGVTGFHKEAKVKGPGVVTGRYGTLGKAYYMHGDFWPLNTSLYVKNFKGNDRKFIYYFLQSQGLERQNVAGAVPGVNRNYLHQLPVRVPPLSSQRKIAAILSAYDDLIENNTRRIQILEEIAQAIYREWFIEFRFPGYESAGTVRIAPHNDSSEWKEIAEGWEISSIGDVVETLGGGTPSTKEDEYWENGHINWFTPSDLTASNSMFIKESSRKINDSGLQNSSAKMFPPYSVMMTSRATIGVTSINTEPACTNQGFITCIPNERTPVYYLYFWIQENLEKIINVASGATYKEINRTEFRAFPIIVPPQNLSTQFFEILNPVGKEIEILLARNKILKQTRDMLLPGLVSGKLQVNELDKMAAE